MRGRGLKLIYTFSKTSLSIVAPRAVAWIETVRDLAAFFYPAVAPRAGAWIETYFLAISNAKRQGVAPRAGAWIETYLCAIGFYNEY